VEALALLGNFIAMLLLILWSRKVERRGEAAAQSGLFGYRPGERTHPLPQESGGAGRPPPAQVPPDPSRKSNRHPP